ncbi:hypothetical protein ACVIGA_002619 [Bradyrhizobium sp. USDA 3240]
MSSQLTVLKVLAGQSAGRASVADLRHAVAILMNSGKDWTDRMKRLAEHAPHLNIFSAKFVLRDDAGWEITEEGRQFLVALEARLFERRCRFDQSIRHSANPLHKRRQMRRDHLIFPGDVVVIGRVVAAEKTDPLAAGRRAML